ncbi:hypothetical protein NQ318_004124 [Aromia moschata]|uniref:DDE-1 domain-containing protein n=1 Tax=Aromia moschata TaxID=1265417 RepID=A0AAV8YMW3_9CUCU|nr:hypothetical protein NQ318_004124 [Aromia moschata]
MYRKECKDWLTTVWPNLRKGYKDEEIFTDETDKLSRERLTVLVAANMTGSEKVKLVIIRKAKQPQCFKNVKSLHTEYENNPRAWMGSVLFEKNITRWDNKFIRQKKAHFIAFNCPAHPNIQNLKAIQLVFLPPNTVSVFSTNEPGSNTVYKNTF